MISSKSYTSRIYFTNQLYCFIQFPIFLCYFQDNKSCNVLEMMSKHEIEMDDRSHNPNSIGVSFNNVKRAVERCKSKYKSTSIIKSLSSYSTCTEGEKYFTNAKGEHYFYTRTGNKHLFVPTESGLKGIVFKYFGI